MPAAKYVTTQSEMFTVVICPDCQYIWIVDGRPNRTACPRCESSHEFPGLRHLEKTEDKVEARNVRAAFTAKLNGMKEEFEQATRERNILDEDVDSDLGPDDRLRERGIDPSEVEDAISEDTGSKSEKEIVVDAIETLDSPTVEEIIEHAGERGVGRSKVEKVLEKLRKRGEIVGKDSIRFV